MSLTASNYTHSVIADPSASQYVAFVGATQNVDDIYVGWHEALGANPIGSRTRASDVVYADEGITYANFFSSSPDGAYDFSGLNNNHRWVKSTDHGLTFADYRSDDLDAQVGKHRPDGDLMLYPHPFFPQATIRLSNGDWLRRINGEDTHWLANNPGTAYCERLVGGSGSWIGAGPSGAVSYWGTTTGTTIQVSRMKEVSPGVIIATGQDFSQPAGTRSGVNYTRPLLRVSTDYGFTWSNGLTLDANWGVATTVASRIFPNEWDVTLLANGNLLGIVRTGGSAPWSGTGAVNTSFRYDQVLLTSDGTNHWSWGVPITWPGNEVIGGAAAPTHPEVLTVMSGDTEHVLFFTRGNSPASAGFYSSDDGGTSWSAITISGKVVNASEPYYPRAILTYQDDVHGVPNVIPTINVVGHFGYDNYPGQVDNKIVLDRFTLPANTPGTDPVLGAPKTAGVVKIGGSVVKLV